jgi:hypothetical protein
MSWSLIGKVQKTRVGSPSAKALLLALANFADEDGHNCFPGQEALSNITELSLDTIQRQLQFLIDRGFVRAGKERRNGRWASWVYTINVAALVDQTASSGIANHAAKCGSAAQDQAAPSGSAEPHHAAGPRRIMRPNPSSHSFKEPRGDGATRIPNEFDLDDKGSAKALEQLGSVEAVSASMERFRNHYRQVAGDKGLSLDWQSKALNWIDDDARRRGSSTADVPAVTIDEGHWDSILRLYAKTRHWTRHVAMFGPDPTSPRCRAPRHLLVKYGLEGEAPLAAEIA